jgi:hypothetical protein
MRRRSLRVALFAALVVAMWTVALPAMAAPAPFCDDRGASGIAAPPVLEPADVAIARALAPMVCDFDDSSPFPAIAPARRVVARSWTAAEPVLIVSPLTVPARQCAFLPSAELDGQPLSGVRCRVERPPRG